MTAIESTDTIESFEEPASEAPLTHEPGKDRRDDLLMLDLLQMGSILSRAARNNGTSASAVLAIVYGREAQVSKGLDVTMPSQIELAQMLGIRPQSLGAIINQLEKDGLVERIRSDQDNRIFLVTLTDVGRNEAKASYKEQVAFAREVLSTLTKREKRQLSNIITKIRTQLA